MSRIKEGNEKVDKEKGGEIKMPKGVYNNHPKMEQHGVTEEEAVWADVDCPKCGGPFVVRDKYGLFCICNTCEWKEREEIDE